VSSARAEYRATVQPQLSAKDLVFLDECSSNAAMAREYGRAASGERVHDAKPVNYGDNLTILGALTLRGLEAVMTIKGATTGEVFLAYVRQVLCPVLRPGQVVVMDNLSAHKVAGVREAIEEVGARVLYLPSYSPDLNPIEPAWSKLKQCLRTAAARTVDALVLAVGDAIRAIAPPDCRGWFRHCGYDPST
jgi:transposase